MFFLKDKYDDVAKLVIACQNQDRRAQSAFYNRYKKRMLGVCQRYAKTALEAEDIFQESFMKIFDNIHKIDNLKSVDKWVKTIVIRTALNYYERTTKKEFRNVALEQMHIEPEGDNYEDVFSRMDMEILLAVISELPNGTRSVVNLYLIDGYTHTEIGVMLSIEESTSKSQLSRGKRLIIKKLKQKGLIKSELVGR